MAGLVYLLLQVSDLSFLICKQLKVLNKSDDACVDSVQI